LQPGDDSPTVAREAIVGDAALDDYRRGAVPLRSGDQAWVYVFAGSTSG
jgi:hypothetical protein